VEGKRERQKGVDKIRKIRKEGRKEGRKGGREGREEGRKNGRRRKEDEGR
jgi:hypothetical protein